MELDHAILCDVASPRPDGKLDVHGIGWDTIFAPTVPVAHPRMDLVIRFLVSPQEAASPHSVRVTLIDADGRELAQLSADVNAMPEEQRQALPAGRRFGLGMILTLAGTVFPEYGTYSLVITWDGNEARSPLTLFVAPPPQV